MKISSFFSLSLFPGLGRINRQVRQEPLNEKNPKTQNPKPKTQIPNSKFKIQNFKSKIAKPISAKLSPVSCLLPPFLSLSLFPGLGRINRQVRQEPLNEKNHKFQIPNSKTQNPNLKFKIQNSK